jgi:hypothetical protein
LPLWLLIRFGGRIFHGLLGRLVGGCRDVADGWTGGLCGWAFKGLTDLKNFVITWLLVFRRRLGGLSPCFTNDAVLVIHFFRKIVGMLRT